VQIGIFWIATAWLAAGLYIAPAISGKELKYQSVSASMLCFGALLLVVVESLTGELLSVKNMLPVMRGFTSGIKGMNMLILDACGKSR